MNTEDPLFTSVAQKYLLQRARARTVWVDGIYSKISASNSTGIRERWHRASASTDLGNAIARALLNARGVGEEEGFRQRFTCKPEGSRDSGAWLEFLAHSVF